MHVTSVSSADKKKEGIAGATRTKIAVHSTALQSNNKLNFQGIRSPLLNYSKTPEADLLLHPS